MRSTIPLLAALASALCAVAPPQAQTPDRRNDTLTAVSGLRVGHHTLTERPTGCTAILVDGEGAVAGLSQRGGAPGTRETDLLDPMNLVERVNGISLAGGSAFGLDAATGVMRWLEEHGLGYDVRIAKVPIVPAAILFDLQLGGKPGVRPDATCGFRAAVAASTDAVQEGSVGAGAGATVGKLGATTAGRSPMKGGIGSAAIALPGGLVVAALVAVNAAGDIVDPSSGKVVAGTLNADGSLADVRALLRTGAIFVPARPGENTTIAVVATNARLTKAQASRMALMADDGLARAIVPSHTLGDGDTVFALATGRWEGEVNVTAIGALAAEVLSDAIVRAATQATGVAGVRAVSDLPK